MSSLDRTCPHVSTQCAERTYAGLCQLRHTQAVLRARSCHEAGQGARSRDAAPAAAAQLPGSFVLRPAHAAQRQLPCNASQTLGAQRPAQSLTLTAFSAALQHQVVCTRSLSLQWQGLEPSACACLHGCGGVHIPLGAAPASLRPPFAAGCGAACANAAAACRVTSCSCSMAMTSHFLSIHPTVRHVQDRLETSGNLNLSLHIRDWT